jgi:hypothetical protein
VAIGGVDGVEEGGVGVGFVCLGIGSWIGILDCSGEEVGVTSIGSNLAEPGLGGSTGYCSTNVDVDVGAIADN